MPPMTNAQRSVYQAVRNLACGATLAEMEQALQVAVNHKHEWLAYCWQLVIAEQGAEDATMYQGVA